MILLVPGLTQVTSGSIVAQYGLELVVLDLAPLDDVQVRNDALNPVGLRTDGIEPGRRARTIVITRSSRPRHGKCLILNRDATPPSVAFRLWL